MSDLRKDTITGIVTQSKLYGIVESLVSHFNNKILGKQDKLTAGTGISISNNTISSTDANKVIEIENTIKALDIDVISSMLDELNGTSNINKLLDELNS